MSKKILLILSFLINALYSSSQENVFVLVDISGSVKNISWITEGKSIVADICLGTFNKAKYPNWKIDGINDSKLASILNGSSSNGLISPNSNFGILRFGDINTIRTASFQPNKIINVSSDFTSYFTSQYPTSFKDHWTYSELAPALVANISKQANINEYYLITIWDGKGEAQAPGENYSQNEDDLINQYKNLPQGDKKGIGVIKIELGNSRYKIVFEKIKLDSFTGVKVNSNSGYSLQITSPKGGTIKNPVTGSKNQLISWNCNCPDTSTYLVRINGVSGNKYRPNPNLATTSSRSYSFSGLESGDYRVTVSLQGGGGATANTVFSVPGTGGGGILWVLLLILAAGATGYFLWNKKREKKIDDKINKPDDIFSGGSSSGATGTSNQGNSGYF